MWLAPSRPHWMRTTSSAMEGKERQATNTRVRVATRRNRVFECWVRNSGHKNSPVRRTLIYLDQVENDVDQEPGFIYRSYESKGIEAIGFSPMTPIPELIYAQKSIGELTSPVAWPKFVNAPWNRIRFGKENGRMANYRRS